MKPKSVSELDLANFTGTEHWHKHSLMKRVLYTDGAQYVAEQCGAYWLLDEIATAQLIKRVSAEEFQCWKLDVPSNTALLTCDDGNGRVVFAKEIEYTDFPEGEMTLYFADNVILLPSEY